MPMPSQTQTATNLLNALSSGERVFGLQEVVDASHMELGTNSTIDQRFDTDVWDYGMDGNPLRVIDFIGNRLDLGQLELSLAEQYDFILPKSELWLIKEEHDLL